MEQCKSEEDDVAEILVGEEIKVKRERKFDLDSMIEQITPENLHPEFDTGPLVGKETWWRSS